VLETQGWVRTGGSLIGLNNIEGEKVNNGNIRISGLGTVIK
jgi:hypothetical protein